MTLPGDVYCPKCNKPFWEHRMVCEYGRYGRDIIAVCPTKEKHDNPASD